MRKVYSRSCTQAVMTAAIAITAVQTTFLKFQNSKLRFTTQPDIA